MNISNSLVLLQLPIIPYWTIVSEIAFCSAWYWKNSSRMESRAWNTSTVLWLTFSCHSLWCPWWIICLKKLNSCLGVGEGETKSRTKWWLNVMNDCWRFKLSFFYWGFRVANTRILLDNLWMRLKWAKVASAWMCDPVQLSSFIKCHLHKLRQILIYWEKSVWQQCSAYTGQM